MDKVSHIDLLRHCPHLQVLRAFMTSSLFGALLCFVGKLTRAPSIILSIFFGPQKTSWSQRGKGSCPQCGTTYHTRYKPRLCPDCSHELGGTYIPKKKPRPEVPKCTVVVRSGAGEGIYSANTSSHDDRCIVMKDKQSSICHHPTCKQQRAVFVNSKKVSLFECRRTGE